MSDLKEYLDKQLSNPEFAIEYKKQRSEYEIAREEIRVQANGNISSTQKSKWIRFGVLLSQGAFLMSRIN